MGRRRTNAVGVLRVGSALDTNIVTGLRASTGTLNSLQIVAKALAAHDMALERQEELSPDLFETVGSAALPVPRTIFDGPCDTRWGPVSPGHYGPIAATEMPAA